MRNTKLLISGIIKFLAGLVLVKIFEKSKMF